MPADWEYADWELMQFSPQPPQRSPYPPLSVASPSTGRGVNHNGDMFIIRNAAAAATATTEEDQIGGAVFVPNESFNQPAAGTNKNTVSK